jgi:hypothetical protein
MTLLDTFFGTLRDRLVPGSDSVYGTNNYSQYPSMLASGVTDEGDFTPFELFAGEADIVTDRGTADVAAIQQFQVISRTATGTLQAWDGVTYSGQGKAIGIAAQPIPAGMTGPYFRGGCFNHAALIWPAAITTVPQRKAAFDDSTIQIGVILGVATPVTYPNPGVI